MLHVQTNGASADKGQDGKDVACADKCCRCGRLLHVRRNVANHVGGEKARKERKFEALQRKIMKIKNAKGKGNEMESV